MKFSIILCVDKDGGIGKDGTLPWNLPSEMRYFRETTLYSNLIMGRKTFDSIPVDLILRKSIVLSRNLPGGLNSVVKGKSLCSFVVERSLHDAVRMAHSSFYRNTFVIGGKEVFEEAFKSPYLDSVYLSRLPDSYGCDTFVDIPQMSLISLESMPGFTLEKYKRS